jgi:hypothetical protein
MVSVLINCAYGIKEGWWLKGGSKYPKRIHTDKA